MAGIFHFSWTGAGHEALNEIQIECAEEMLNAEDLSNIAKSKFVTQSPNGNSETFNGTATRNQLLREISIPQRRARTRKSHDGPFSTIEKLGERCQVLGVELCKLVNRFQFMADDAARKRKVYGVMSKIEGLTKEEAIKVGAIIASDTAKINYLFSVPDHSKNFM